MENEDDLVIQLVRVPEDRPAGRPERYVVFTDRRLVPDDALAAELVIKKGTRVVFDAAAPYPTVVEPL